MGYDRFPEQLVEEKRVVLEEIDRLATDGPTEQEVARVKAAREAGFLRGIENLNHRADKLNDYYRHFGAADGFGRDLARWTKAAPEDLRAWAAKVCGLRSRT